MTNQPSAAIKATRAVAVACVLALILMGLAWELWLAPLRPGGSWLALKVVPLALALPGLMRYRMFTYRWVSLLIWAYFAEGVVRATTEPPPARLLASAEITLTLILFVVCALHVRWRQKSARARTQSLEHSP